MTSAQAQIPLFGRDSNSSEKLPWLRQMILSANPLKSDRHENALIEVILDAVYGEKCDDSSRRLLLAAGFDLLVAAEYYRSVAHLGWLYCPVPACDPLLLYPYVSVCPRCVLKQRFEHQKANKPKSGSIGATTSRLLSLYLQSLLRKKKLSVQVLKGREPVDVIFLDSSTAPKTAFFAEVKAAPLVTLPLAAVSQQLTMEQENRTQAVEHRVADFSNLFGSTIGILVPHYDDARSAWTAKVFPIGTKNGKRHTGWSYEGLLRLIKEDSVFVRDYFSFWEAAFQSYEEQDRDEEVYWFTNACGQPSPRPSNWPRRRGGSSGYESISDSKTSAGMDRTDDLKKATYQVLKIGAEGKPSAGYSYKVGIVSNIHAVRHFDEYLGSLIDIIWTRDETGTVRRARDLLPDTELFNLYDGVVTLTKTWTRDEWMGGVFDF